MSGLLLGSSSSSSTSSGDSDNSVSIENIFFRHGNGDNANNSGRQGSFGEARIQSVKKTKQYLEVKKSFYLHCRSWKPQDKLKKDVWPKALLIICHGLTEHLNCYDEMATHLASDGIIVFGHDLQGHGLSNGKRGLIQDICEPVKYILYHSLLMKSQYPKVPLFIYGHSMGGLLGVRSCLHNPGLFKGLILESPLLEFKDDFKTLLVNLSLRFLISLTPEFPLVPLKNSEITSEESNFELLDNDPLRVKGPVRAGTLQALIRGVDDTAEMFKDFRVPFTIFHGANDELCLPDGSQELFDVSLEAQDKNLTYIKGTKHKLLLEEGEVKEHIIRSTMKFINQRI